MNVDPASHRRRSIRLKGHDYSRTGAYFVTICTQDRACLFGDVVAGDMRLNEAGRMIQSIWDEMPAFYPGVDTDAFVVMPNHVHGRRDDPPWSPRRRRATRRRAGTGACPYVVIGGCGASVQNDDHQTICERRQAIRVARILRTIVATQLLRAHRPRRGIPEPHPPLHPRQSGPMGGGP